MTPPRGVAPALLGTAAVAFGLFAEQERRGVGRPLDLALLDLLAGFVFIGAGAVVYVWRPTNRCWWLLMGAGASWFISTLAGSMTEDLSLVGFAFGGWHYLFLAWLLLAFPTGRIASRRGHLLLGAMTLVLVIRTLSRLFLFVPADGTGCNCVRNRFVPVTDRRWFEAVEDVYPWAIATLVALVIIETLVRWRNSSGAGRRMLMPVVALGSAAALQIIYSQVLRHQLAWAVIRADDLFLLVVLVRSCAALSIVMGLRRTSSTRSAVVGLVGELNDSADPARLGVALQRALEDPSLVLLPWSETAGGFVDPEGTVTTSAPQPGPGRAVTLIQRDGGPLAVLVHDEALLEDPGLVSAITAAVRLSVDNEQLRSELQRRLDDLAASRERIIAAGDDERRRIERDLHDGTQQRLVTIALQLRLAEARLPSGHENAAVREVLTRAVGDLGEAVIELRDLARGIHPAILVEAGLEPALESLVDRSRLPVELAIDVAVEPPAPVAATVYFTVSEALTNIAKHAGAQRVTLQVTGDSETLFVLVTDDGVGGATSSDGSRLAGGSGLSGLADRVSASGGTLSLHSPPGGGTRIEVVLPCA